MAQYQVDHDNCVMSHCSLCFIHAASGVVHIYDLAARQRLLQPVAQLRFEGHEAASGHSRSSAGINALAFNSKVPGLLAAAAGDAVCVWQLPPVLTQPRAGEAVLLKRLLGSKDVLGLLKAQCIATS